MQRTILILALLFSVALSWSADGLSEESKQPSTKSEFRVVYANNWNPISYIENGQTKGILPNQVEHLLGQVMGLTVKHIAVPWGRAQKMIREGAADAFITTATPERLTYSTPTKDSLFYVPFVLATLKESTADQRLKSPDNLMPVIGSTFCDVLGNGWAKQFYQNKPVKVHYAPTIEECLKMLQVGRVSGIIHAQAVIKYYADTMGMSKNIHIFPTPAQSSPSFPILISNKSVWKDRFLKDFNSRFSQILDIQMIINEE
ncbi:MAG: substrate-binding periplasmic protein [Terasakiella sp.]|uniref:substrate-binding periplasmic protein n=1 Tax=unclassified Terasakiella TaxID=2614952 RepID=UPI003B003BF8